MKQEHNILKLAFEYGLSKIKEQELNLLIEETLTKEQKIQSLLQLDDDKIKPILYDMGFEKEFLETI